MPRNIRGEPFSPAQEGRRASGKVREVAPAEERRHQRWERGAHRVLLANSVRLIATALIETLQSDIALSPRGRLRSRKELDDLKRTNVPTLEELRKQGPNEQTLQWMFMRRTYFGSVSQSVLLRELPTSCSGQSVEGRADLLVYDEVQSRPILVELKRARATDPLTRVVLEALSHWVFHVQHWEEFQSQLGQLGYIGANRPGIAIAAPETYFSAVKRRNRKPRANECEIAWDWVTKLRESNLLEIQLYAIENEWLSTGGGFRMWSVKA